MLRRARKWVLGGQEGRLRAETSTKSNLFIKPVKAELRSFILNNTSIRALHVQGSEIPNISGVEKNRATNKTK